jgi:hypothetical protein
MISWRHLKVSVSTKKKVMLYEYEVSVIVCSTEYLNTQITLLSIKMMEKRNGRLKENSLDSLRRLDYE